MSPDLPFLLYCGFPESRDPARQAAIAAESSLALRTYLICMLEEV